MQAEEETPEQAEEEAQAEEGGGALKCQVPQEGADHAATCKSQICTYRIIPKLTSSHHKHARCVTTCAGTLASASRGQTRTYPLTTSQTKSEGVHNRLRMPQSEG